MAGTWVAWVTSFDFRYDPCAAWVGFDDDVYGNWKSGYKCYGSIFVDWDNYLTYEITYSPNKAFGENDEEAQERYLEDVARGIADSLNYYESLGGDGPAEDDYDSIVDEFTSDKDAFTVKKIGWGICGHPNPRMADMDAGRIRCAGIEDYGGGNCFEVALLNATANPELDVVHGVVCGQGPLEGIAFPHAWNEWGGVVIDDSNGRSVEMPASAYYAIGNIDESKVFRYSYREAIEMAVDFETYGPWVPELDFDYVVL